MKELALVVTIICVAVIIIYVCYCIELVISRKIEFAYKASELAISNESKKIDVNAIRCDDYIHLPDRNKYKDKHIDILTLDSVYKEAYRQGFEDCKYKVNGILN